MRFRQGKRVVSGATDKSIALLKATDEAVNEDLWSLCHGDLRTTRFGL
jgi:hypothetical protein